MFFEMDKHVIPSGNYHTIQCNCTTLKSRTVKIIVPSSEARTLPSCYECNFSNCVEMSEKLRTSAGFEPKTSWCQYDALINWATGKFEPTWSTSFCCLWPYISVDQRGHRFKPHWSPEFFGILLVIAKIVLIEGHSFTWFHISSSLFYSLYLSFRPLSIVP